MSLPEFKPPEFKLEAKRRATLSFRVVVAAGGFGGQSSGRITYPFRIVEASMNFQPEFNYLIGIRWLVDTGLEVSTTDWSSGNNIFGREAPTATFYDRAINKKIQANVEYPDGDLFIKMSVYNGSVYAYTVTGSITIEEM